MKHIKNTILTRKTPNRINPSGYCELPWMLEWTRYFSVINREHTDHLYCQVSFFNRLLVVCSPANISHFHLLQDHWNNFNQTWHSASLGEGNSSLFKWRTMTYNRKSSENTLTTFRPLDQFQPTSHKTFLYETGSSSYK